MDERKLLGKRIQEIRKSRNLTQEKLAEMVGLEPNSISVIESGRNFPTLLNLTKISRAMKVELSDLFIYDYLDSRKNLMQIIDNKISSMDDRQLRHLFRYINNVIL